MTRNELKEKLDELFVEHTKLKAEEDERYKKAIEDAEKAFAESNDDIADGDMISNSVTTIIVDNRKVQRISAAYIPTMLYEGYMAIYNAATKKYDKTYTRGNVYQSTINRKNGNPYRFKA